MSAVNKTASSGKDLVLGLGATGLSIARYLQRNDGDAIFVDSRDEPPGIDELNEVWPDANVVLGSMKLPGKVDRIIVSPGVADDNELLKKARKKKL
jgi:UDP-N-acetylmuramoylalanine--D-glutamate ligase